MIYAATFTKKDSDGNINTQEEKILISGLNDANALDILSKYCEYGIGIIKYFQMVGESADGSIITLDSANTTFTVISSGE